MESPACESRGFFYEIKLCVMNLLVGYCVFFRGLGDFVVIITDKISFLI